MSIFISYSHQDQKWLDELKIWLEPLVRKNIIKIWDDTHIQPGDDWREEIDKSLAGATAALLLVTKNFIASKFIYKNELIPLLDRAATKGVKILWIAVGWSAVGDTDIMKYQALNDPSHPLESLNEAERNLAYSQIYEKIKKVVQK
jgi:hypothetical protein